MRGGILTLLRYPEPYRQLLISLDWNPLLHFLFSNCLIIPKDCFNFLLQKRRGFLPSFRWSALYYLSVTNFWPILFSHSSFWHPWGSSGYSHQHEYLKGPRDVSGFYHFGNSIIVSFRLLSQQSLFFGFSWRKWFLQGCYSDYGHENNRRS